MARKRKFNSSTKGDGEPANKKGGTTQNTSRNSTKAAGKGDVKKKNQSSLPPSKVERLWKSKNKQERVRLLRSLKLILDGEVVEKLYNVAARFELARTNFYH